MELFQLVRAAMVQGVGRPRGLGRASLGNTLHNRGWNVEVETPEGTSQLQTTTNKAKKREND